MDSDNEYEADSGEEDSYDYTGEESNPEEMSEEVTEERCRFDWQDEDLDNKERGERLTILRTNLILLRYFFSRKFGLRKNCHFVLVGIEVLCFEPFNW